MTVLLNLTLCVSVSVSFSPPPPSPLSLALSICISVSFCPSISLTLHFGWRGLRPLCQGTPQPLLLSFLGRGPRSRNRQGSCQGAPEVLRLVAQPGVGERVGQGHLWMRKEAKRPGRIEVGWLLALWEMGHWVGNPKDDFPLLGLGPSESASPDLFSIPPVLSVCLQLSASVSNCDCRSLSPLGYKSQTSPHAPHLTAVV